MTLAVNHATGGVFQLSRDRLSITRCLISPPLLDATPMAAVVSAVDFVKTANVVYIARTCQGQSFLIRVLHVGHARGFTVASSVAVLYDHGKYHVLCDLDGVVDGRVHSHHVRSRGKHLCLWATRMN